MQTTELNAPLQAAVNSAVNSMPSSGTGAQRFSINSPSVPVSLLNQQHPTFALYVQTWSDLALLYDDGPELKTNAARFLKMRPKELKEIYQARLDGFTYQNILSTGLGWYISKLFSEEPEIDIKVSGRAIQPPDAKTGKQGDPEFEYYDEFQRDCDRSGTSFPDFLREIYRQAMLFRKTYVLLDLPPEVGTAPSAGEQQVEPYLCIYDPRAAINWQTDRYGNLDWIVFATESTQTGFLTPNVTVNRWYYYDKREYRIFEHRSDSRSESVPTATLIDTGLHAMADYRDDPDEGMITGRVPVVCLELPRGLWLAGRVILQVLDHLNTENSLKWGLLLANLAMPYIKTDGEYEPSLSEAGMIKLRQGDDFGFAEPSGKSFEISATRLGALREEIYRTMYLQAQGRSSEATPAAQSGYSKEMDMAPSKDILNAFAGIMRGTAQTILGLISAVRRDTTIEFDVRGLVETNDPVLNDLVAIQQVMMLGIQSDTFHSEAQKDFIRAYGSHWNKDLIAEMCAEIDASPTKSEVDAAQQQADQQQLDKAMNAATTKIITSAGNGKEAAN